MNHIVDTCAWIEWLMGSPLADTFDHHLQNTSKLLVPTLIQFELYRWVCREKDKSTAIEIIAITEQAHVIPLDTQIALHAAEVAHTYRLAMADAIIYSTAIIHEAKLITCDKHFEKLPHVHYCEK